MKKLISIMLLFVLLLNPAALALAWNSPYWNEAGHPTTIEIYEGESAEAVSGVYNSWDDSVSYGVELQTSDGTRTIETLERTRDISFEYEIVDGRRTKILEPQSTMVTDSDYPGVGSYRVLFTMEDSRSGPQEKYINLRVLPEIIEEEHDPVLRSIGDKSVYAGSTLSFSVQATDEDGDDLTITASGKPSDATFSRISSGNYIFTWDPEESDVGSRDVTFTAIDETGRSNEEEITITVRTRIMTDPRPEVEIRILENDRTECHPHTFVADVTTTYPITAYVWSFDDGTGTERTSSNRITHYFEDDGTYDVEVTAYTAVNGTNSDTDSVRVRVHDVDPNLVLRADRTTISEGELVVFDTTSSVPCDAEEITEFVWNFDDGSATVTETTGTVRHSFSNAGIYDVTARVYDEDSYTQRTIRITVEDDTTTELVADFDYSPRHPEVGDDITLEDLSTPQSEITSWRWWIDGSATTYSESRDPVISFIEEGDYEVCLTVSNTETSSRTTCQWITVEDETVVEPLEVDLYIEDVTGVAPHTTLITCEATGGSELYDYVIETGTGRTYDRNTVTYTYGTAGDYKATCTVTDSDGTVESDSEDVHVTSEPVEFEMSLDATPETGHAPLAVRLTCDATGISDSNEYLIHPGDGSYYTSNDVDHTYTDIGSYTAYCWVRDTDGVWQSATTVVEVTEDVGPSVVSVDLSASRRMGNVPFTVEYTCSAPGYTNPTNYLINPGDGSSFNTNEISVTYDRPGDYTAYCWLRDEFGLWHMDSELISAMPATVEELEVRIGRSPHEGEAPFETEFSCTVTGGVEPYTVTLDTDVISSSDIIYVFVDHTDTVFHTYEIPGSYRSECVVEDSTGATATDDLSTYVTEPTDSVPTVYFRGKARGDATYTGDAIEGDSPLTIEFGCKIIDGNEPIEGQISFGDGSASTDDLETTHTYDVDGLYTAVCSGTDADGDYAEDTITIIVGTTTSDLIADIGLGIIGENQYEVSCEAENGVPPTTETIDFGDGSDPVIATYATHTYTTEGTYKIVCSVSDSTGATDEDQRSITIGPSTDPLDVDFNIELRDHIGPRVYEFECEADGGQPGYDYVLDFGDGSPTINNNEYYYSYTSDGTYVATCTATDSFGESVTENQTIIVGTSSTLDVEIEMTQRTDIAEHVYEIDCLATGGEPEYNYVIDFGDGSATVADQDAVHAYPLSGTFTATCNVEDSVGNTESATQTITIEGETPDVEASITVTQRTDIAEHVYEIDCSATGGEPGYSYTIDFGDGATIDDNEAVHAYPLEGTFTATCYVEDSEGETDNAEQTITIGDSTPLDAYIESVSRLGGSDSTTFMIDCDATGGVPPYNFTLDFGDGSDTVNVDDEEHTYMEGTYTITCTVTDEAGNTDMDTHDLTVSTSGTVEFDFEWDPILPEVDEEVNFTLYAIGSPTPMVTSVSWDFDDGVGISTETDPVYAFSAPGEYDVSVEVTTDDGMVYHARNEIMVGINAPIAYLTLTHDTGVEPHVVIAQCDSVGGDRAINMQMDWGDGSAVEEHTSSDDFDPISFPALFHEYEQNGDYDVTCTVTDADGESTTDSEDVAVADSDPEIIDLEASETSLLVMEDVYVTFEVESYDLLDDVEIDFGDGESETISISGTDDDYNGVFDHAYATAGVYRINVTARDIDGSVVEDYLTVTVGLDAFEVRLSVEQDGHYEPVTVEPLCSANGGVRPYSYTILYGDGESVDASFGTHTYEENGVYTIICNVEDSTGAEAATTQEIIINDTIPDVLFISTPSNPTEGESVHFESVVDAFNDDDVVLYHWDFDDGDDSSESDPDHVFELDGTYNVTLSVMDDDGSTNVAWEEITVGDDYPVPSLFVDPTSGPEGTNVTYNCELGGGNPPYTIHIDLGNGIIESVFDTEETSFNTSYVHDVFGTFVSTCTAIDSDGNSRTSPAQTVTISDNAPVVNITGNGYDETIEIREGEELDLLCTIEGGDELFDVNLDWVSSSMSEVDTSERVFRQDDVTYALEGLYTVTCEVRDSDSDHGHDELLVNVTNYGPRAILDTNVTNGLEPLSVNYTCEGAEGNGDYTYDIDFGDGTAIVHEPTGEHEYMSTGNYSLNCTVYDEDGDFDSDDQEIRVSENLPVVDLSYVAYGTMEEGVEIGYTCLVTNGNPDYEIVIDAGDGRTETYTGSDMEFTYNFTYAAEGNFTANCTVTDNDGDVQFDEEDIVIANNAPLTRLTIDDWTGFEPHLINYNCEILGGNEPITTIIDFGDGIGSTTELSGNYTFTTPGEYNVTCSSTDTDEDESVDSQIVVVENSAPTVDLTYSSLEPIREGVDITFDCLVSGENPGFETVIEFGDGFSKSFVRSASDENTATFSVTRPYTLEGEYNATCRAEDIDGDFGEDNETIIVNNNEPVVNLISNYSITDTTIGMEPLPILMNCTVGEGNEPYAFSLDLDDGTAPLAVSVRETTYTQNGTYSATCMVRDTDGDEDTDVMTVIVQDSVPEVNFTYTPESPIEGDVITFIDDSYAFDGIRSYAWDFGDGNTSTDENPTHHFDLIGDYDVILTVTDNDGSERTMTQTVHVGDNVPIVTVTIGDDNGIEPHTTTVTCSATGGNPGPGGLVYNMQYGDGDSIDVSGTTTHTYDEDGTYPATCYVTDVDGDVGVGSHVVNVNDTNPIANFDFSPASPDILDVVEFYDRSTGYDDITGWSWDFNGDGVGDAFTQNASHTFSTPGSYFVNLTVTDSDGSTASVVGTVNVAITVAAPTISDVRVDDLTNISATIHWGTEQLATSVVEYGLDESLGTTVNDASYMFNHNIPLSGLDENTTYYFNLTSCNSYGECSTSGPYDFTTSPAPDTTAPGSVSGLDETGVGSDWIEWSWTNPTDADFDHVEIIIDGVFVTNVTGNSYNVTGLSPETTYTIEVVPVDTEGNRNSPGETDSATTGAGPDETAPGVVTGLDETSYGSDFVFWEWTNPTDVDFDHVEVYLDGSFVMNTSGTNVNITGLTELTTYSIELFSVDATGNVNPTGVSDSATTISGADVTAPGDVTGLGEIDVGLDYIEWSWTNPTDVDFDHVEIWLNGTFVMNTTDVSYNATGLTDATVYEITIYTVDTTGNVNAGTSDTATTDTIVDTTPIVTASASPISGPQPLGVNLSATVVGGNGVITYSWDVDSDGTEDYTTQNPLHIYNTVGTYTASVTATDEDGDSTTDTVDITVEPVQHDIAVLDFTYTNEGRTVYLYDDVEVDYEIENQGNVQEDVTVVLEVNGTAVDSKVVTVAAGVSATGTFDWDADTAGETHNVVVRAITVAGESDLSDQSVSKVVEVYSVEDVVGLETRFIEVDTLGRVYVPVLNSYEDRGFYDLKVELSSPTITIPAPALQIIDLAPSETRVLTWVVPEAIIGSGAELVVTEGNDELVLTTVI